MRTALTNMPSGLKENFQCGQWLVAFGQLSMLHCCKWYKFENGNVPKIHSPLYFLNLTLTTCEACEDEVIG